MSEASDGVISHEKPDDVAADRPANVLEQSAAGSTTVDAQEQGSQAGNPVPTSESAVDSERYAGGQSDRVYGPSRT